MARTSYSCKWKVTVPKLRLPSSQKPSQFLHLTVKMAAINALVARDAVMHLAKRKNWAQREVGVVVVFAILFVVAVGIITAQIFKCLQRRKERKPVQ
jgi:hypothetical protein